MANNRAAKSGFAAEAQRKINSKYNEEHAAECLEWIKAITGEPSNTSGDMENFYAVLNDGVLLCRQIALLGFLFADKDQKFHEHEILKSRYGLKEWKIFDRLKLVNTLKPGAIKKINESKMAFKCMENINNFLENARSMGVPAQETFQTVDLWEKQNLNSVVICLQSLGRKGAQYGQPSIGPKEADKNVRNFTEEQMRAGQGVISLQYGSNKGANQSGINFGNTRHM